jgi:hypothetical protein
MLHRHAPEQIVEPLVSESQASLALPRAACALSTAILPASPERRSPQPSPHRGGHEFASRFSWVRTDFAPPIPERTIEWH